MIQLTKGTNVLDINLSDYSGAGQDVVQNGSFDDIGSDLVTNGDFSAAGISLVDNPNFTDTGSELVVNGDFATDSNWTKLGGATISGGKAIIDGNGTSFTAISQASIFTEGNSYIVTADVTITSGLGLKFQDGANNENIGFATTSGSYTFYFVATSNTTLVIGRRTGGTAFESSVDNVSIKELGEDWTAYTSGTSTVEYNSSGANLLIDSAANGGSNVGVYQENIFELGKSYKIVLSMKATASFDAEVVESNLAATENVIGTVSLTTSFQDFTFYYVGTGTFDLFIHRLYNGGGASQTISIQSVVVQELGEGWTLFSDVSVGEDKLICDNVAAYTSIASQSGTVPTEKSVKVTYDVVVDSGAFRLLLGSGGTTTEVTTSGTKVFYETSGTGGALTLQARGGGFDGTVTNISVQQLDTNDRWVTFADPNSKSVMKQGQVDLEIDSSGNNCGVYQTGLIKPNKLYIITINMKATAAINVEIAASLGTAVSAVIGTETLTTSYKEYSFEYVTPFAVNHDLQIHRLFGSGANETISIDYVSMNGVDESQWTNDPTWDPFATSLVFVPTLTDESTNNSKQFTLDTSISDGGWDGRSLHGQIIINEFPAEVPASGIINLKQPDFLEGFYQVEIRGYLGTFYRVLGKCMAHLERASTEDGYNRFESYNDTVTYKAYEE